MTGTASISFWQRNLHWYVQQQSWTQSFYQADRNWTAELSGDTGSTAKGSASIAKQEPLSIVDARTESASTGALPSGLSNATGGAVLDLLV
jgi:hypothetical protein